MCAQVLLQPQQQVELGIGRPAAVPVELEEMVPIAFLPKDHALAIAVMSYNGRLDFGLLADYDAFPDLDDFAGYLDDAVGELLDAAGARAAVPA